MGVVSAPLVILHTVRYFNEDLSIPPASKIAILKFVGYLALSSNLICRQCALCISSAFLTIHWETNLEFGSSFEELSVCQVTLGG